MSLSESVSGVYPARRLPGDFAMWALIIMELSVFALLFIWYAVLQRLDPAMVSAGRGTLSLSSGLICTLSLLTASYLVANAVAVIKHDKPRWGFYFLIAAILVSSIYFVAKASEFRHLTELGYGISTNRFFTLYFFATFFHMLHVVVGVGILGWLARQSWRNVYSSANHTGVESGASYWHMVDLVWVILFFLIYVSP